MIRTDVEFANMVYGLVAKSESTVVDYKALLCLDNDAEKAEFIKDFVGFANTVMLKGIPSYILFGYDEKKGEFFNIFASQIPGKEFKRWWNPEESEDRNISNVTHRISQLIRTDNIKPIAPLYDPEFGKLDVEVETKEGKKISKQVLVGYLKIYPSFYPETPYHICNENYIKKLVTTQAMLKVINERC